MQKNVEKFWNTFYEKGFTKKDELLREMIRIKLTKLYLQNNDLPIKEVSEDADKLYKIMKSASEENIGYFPGDRVFFQEIFKLGKEIDLLDFTLQTYKNDRTGKIISPKYLTHHIISIIKTENPISILITEAEKNLKGLKKVLETFPDKKFTLTSENKLMYLVLKLYFDKFSNVNVKFQSIYRRLLLKDRFDLIFSIPTFGEKFDLDEIPDNYMMRESEGIAVENLLNYINKEGNLYAIVPAKFTFSGGGFKNLRKHITQKYNLDFIYTLPEGTFRPYTSIKTYMLSISNEKKKKIKLGNLVLEKERLNLEDEKEIPIEDFAKYSDWRVDLFLSENLEEIEKFKQSKVDKVKLKTVAEIFRGKSIMKKDLRPGNTHVLNISNIENGQILFDDLDTIDEEERKIKRYELMENDLVITCRGTVNKVAVFKGTDKQVIASANIIVVRFKEEIISDYIKIFMESPIGTTMIKSFQRGTVVMNINPKDIGEMVVPILPLQKQKQIVKQYNDELYLYINTIKSAEKRWKDKRTKIYEDILK